MGNDLVSAFSELRKDEAIHTANVRIKCGVDPSAILADCRKGMAAVMERYESREYYLDSVVAAFDLWESIEEVLNPLLPGNCRKPLGTMVIGTVQYDIHDVGKNMAARLLRAIGFEVHDLGVDVPPGRFVDELRRTGASILGLSGMTSSCFESMKRRCQAKSPADTFARQITPKWIICGPQPTGSCCSR
jgi:methanogenic corrinoid protein MtbC1